MNFGEETKEKVLKKVFDYYQDTGDSVLANDVYDAVAPYMTHGIPVILVTNSVHYRWFDCALLSWGERDKAMRSMGIIDCVEVPGLLQGVLAVSLREAGVLSKQFFNKKDEWEKVRLEIVQLGRGTSRVKKSVVQCVKEFSEDLVTEAIEGRYDTNDVLGEDVFGRNDSKGILEAIEEATFKYWRSSLYTARLKDEDDCDMASCPVGGAPFDSIDVKRLLAATREAGIIDDTRFCPGLNASKKNPDQVHAYVFTCSPRRCSLVDKDEVFFLKEEAVKKVCLSSDGKEVGVEYFVLHNVLYVSEETWVEFVKGAFSNMFRHESGLCGVNPYLKEYMGADKVEDALRWNVAGVVFGNALELGYKLLTVEEEYERRNDLG